MAKPSLYIYNANIEWTLSDALVYSFIVFKYVNLILLKTKMHFGGFWEKLN